MVNASYARGRCVVHAWRTRFSIIENFRLSLTALINL